MEISNNTAIVIIALCLFLILAFVIYITKILGI